MLELKNVSYIIEENNQQKTILKDISLRFPKNRRVVITGQNGSGKSTLIKLIMGIIEPSSGQILFDGKDITNLAIHERARLGITLAFQQPVKFKGLKVKDLLDVASGQKNSLGQSCDYLSKVGLCAKNYINRELDGTLSGGELKRIELAMALAKGGELLLFDEPEAGIDLWSFDSLVSLFKEIKSTVIIVSHQKKILEQADDILLLDSDSHFYYGTRDDILPYLSAPAFCKKLEDNNG